MDWRDELCLVRLFWDGTEAVPPSSALHRRHDRDLVARFDHVIALDEFDARADKNRLIMRAEWRHFVIKLFEQIGDRCSLIKIDVERVPSGQIAEMRIELHANLHRRRDEISLSPAGNGERLYRELHVHGVQRNALIAASKVARHPDPAAGTTLPMAAHIDRASTRAHHPTAAHPDVIGARPAPITGRPSVAG